MKLLLFLLSCVTCCAQPMTNRLARLVHDPVVLAYAQSLPALPSRQSLAALEQLLPKLKDSGATIVRTNGILQIDLGRSGPDANALRHLDRHGWLTSFAHLNGALLCVQLSTNSTGVRELSLTITTNSVPAAATMWVGNIKESLIALNQFNGTLNRE